VVLPWSTWAMMAILRIARLLFDMVNVLGMPNLGGAHYSMLRRMNFEKPVSATRALPGYPGTRLQAFAYLPQAVDTFGRQDGVFLQQPVPSKAASDCDRRARGRPAPARPRLPCPAAGAGRAGSACQLVAQLHRRKLRSRHPPATGLAGSSSPAASGLQRDRAIERERADSVRRRAFRCAPQPSASPISSPSTRM
jgi:hypothetical protein